jgi:hypothetical protein
MFLTQPSHPLARQTEATAGRVSALVFKFSSYGPSTASVDVRARAPGAYAVGQLASLVSAYMPDVIRTRLEQNPGFRLSLSSRGVELFERAG